MKNIIIRVLLVISFLGLAACSNGMSDEDLWYEATDILDEEVLSADETATYSDIAMTTISQQDNGVYIVEGNMYIEGYYGEEAYNYTVKLNYDGDWLDYEWELE